MGAELVAQQTDWHLLCPVRVWSTSHRNITKTSAKQLSTLPDIFNAQDKLQCFLLQRCENPQFALHHQAQISVLILGII